MPFVVDRRPTLGSLTNDGEYPMSNIYPRAQGWWDPSTTVVEKAGALPSHMQGMVQTNRMLDSIAGGGCFSVGGAKQEVSLLGNQGRLRYRRL